MSDAPTPEALDRLEGLAKEATPGEWRWRNTNNDPMLLGARSLVVMAFERMGMHGAQPVFRGPDNLLRPAGRENIYEFADAAYIAAANPDTIRALIAEVRELRESQRAFADALGFGNGVTEPAASLEEMVEPLSEAMSEARDHAECPAICELCGEWLASKTCSKCHGSGCLPNIELAHMECDECAGVGKVHEGCAELSYAELRATLSSASVGPLIGRVQALEDQREDLRGRMERARDEIRRMAEETPLLSESTRLSGKAEGIALCLDYLRGME